MDFPDLGRAQLDAAPGTWLPGAQALVDACAAAADAGPPAGLNTVLGTVSDPTIGAPPLDLTATPISTRAALLAAQHGHAFYHHELRLRLPMPTDQMPELAPWDQATVPVWNRGVLQTPAHFPDFLDAPFAVFNPQQTRKSQPRGLLRCATKFFWHPQMTRFELYVGARIHEILPAANWYGWGEVFRARCPQHRGKLFRQDYCADCEALLEPYWQSTPQWRAERRDEAIEWATHGLTRFEQEWQACVAELETGRVHPVQDPWGDTSAHAVGYMRSHWNRLTSWNFGAWAETFLTDEIDYFSALDRYMEHVAHTARHLLGGRIALDPAHCAHQRARRAIQDAAYRIYLAMSWLKDDSPAISQVAARLTPALEQAAHHVHHAPADARLSDYSQDVLFDLLGAFDDVRTHFPNDIARAVDALGYTWCAPEQFAHAAHSQLYAGLCDAMPSTTETLGDSLDALIDAFSLSPEFRGHGLLAARFADWLNARQDHTHHDTDAHPDDASALTAAELANFEAWATCAPTEDHTANRFASLPHSFEEFAIRPGRVRPNRTLLRRAYTPATAALITGDDQWLTADKPVEIARIFMRGELHLRAITPSDAQILAHIDAHDPRQDWIDTIDPDRLASLLEDGFIIWLPAPF